MLNVLGAIVIGVLALVGAAVVLGIGWLWWKFREHTRDHAAKSREEQKVIEEADWFGKTGLDEITERELPRYLRREFGESLFDEGSLKAASLKYMGSFPENGGTTHYWKIPYGKDERVFAYVDVATDDGGSMGWGGREPPSQA